MRKGWPIPPHVGGWQHLICLLHTAATPTMPELCARMRRCAVEFDKGKRVEAAYDPTAMHAQRRQLYESTTIGTKAYGSA